MKIPRSKLSLIQKKIRSLEKQRKSRIILFLDISFSLNSLTALYLHKLVRKMGKIEKLDLILDSSGGEIDSAVKISNICKEYSKEFNVIVPFYAKSAATLIAISADNLLLCKAGELGPLDPQFMQPEIGSFPAQAINDTLEFVYSIKDHNAKQMMMGKINPFIIGKFNHSIRAAKQYIEEISCIKDSRTKSNLIFSLVGKYLHHGYPIDKKMCSSLKLNNCTKKLPQEIENEIYAIHESLVDMAVSKGIDLIIITSEDSIVKSIR